MASLASTETPEVCQGPDFSFRGQGLPELSAPCGSGGIWTVLEKAFSRVVEGRGGLCRPHVCSAGDSGPKRLGRGKGWARGRPDSGQAGRLLWGRQVVVDEAVM